MRGGWAAWRGCAGREAGGATFAGAGGVYDPDRLEVGNCFWPGGDAEGRSQFSVWGAMKAPLLIGTDVTNMTAATLATLTNPEAIAVNQDALAIAGSRLRMERGVSVWSKLLSDGSRGVLLLNARNEAALAGIHWHELIVLQSTPALVRSPRAPESPGAHAPQT